MDIPPNHIWPEGSAAGQPYPPGSGEPARPLLHLIGLTLFNGPVLVGLLVMAICFIDLDDLDAIGVALLVLAAGVWGLLVVATIKAARESLAAIRKRKLEQPRVEDPTSNS